MRTENTEIISVTSVSSVAILKILLILSNLLLYMQNGTPLVLIYDARCSLCRGCMKWIELHAIQKDAFEFIPCQSEQRRILFPEMTDETCLKSFQLVLSHNQILAGEKALPEIINRLKGFRWLSCLFKTPGIRVFLYAIYRWVANNRYIISQTVKPLIEE